MKKIQVQAFEQKAQPKDSLKTKTNLAIVGGLTFLRSHHLRFIEMIFRFSEGGLAFLASLRVRLRKAVSVAQMCLLHICHQILPLAEFAVALRSFKSPELVWVVEFYF